MPGVTQPTSTTSPTADQYLQVGEARLHYRDEGAGPPIVLLHGWTLDLEMWDPQVALLRDSFRLIRLDRRGFGLSSGDPDSSCDVGDLDALCRHLALERAALIGMSQGVRSALGFAALAPQRVATLILDGPPALVAESSDADLPMQHFRFLAQSQGIESFRREWRRHPLTQLHTRDPAMHSLLRTMLERYRGTDLVGAGSYIPDLPQRTLDRVSAPTLVLTGELDVATRIASAHALSRQLPRAQRASVAGAGHLPNLDNPVVYTAVCRSFLIRHLPPQVIPEVPDHA
jgi:pimeloyl-ACP methyl ester carboxylesterase